MCDIYIKLHPIAIKSSRNVYLNILHYSTTNNLKLILMYQCKFTSPIQVDACWIPRIWERETEAAYVKFVSTEAAEQALNAIATGMVQMHGVPLEAHFRKLTPDTKRSGPLGRRDEDYGGGSGFEGSRAMFLSSRDMFMQDRQKQRRSRSRDRNRRRDSRRRSKKDSRSRDRGRKKSRGRGRDDSRGRKSRRNDSRERSKSRDTKDNKSGGGRTTVTVDKYLGEKMSLGLKLNAQGEITAFEIPEAEDFGWKIGDRIRRVTTNNRSIDVQVSSTSEVVQAVIEVKKANVLPIFFGVDRD